MVNVNRYGGVCNVENPDKRVYNLWYGMLRRCYDKKQHERDRGKSYADCEVCDRWLNFNLCELSEAVEEYRAGHPMVWANEDGKPEGIATEMADCLIRILDWFGHEGLDADEIVRQKMAYNRGRPYKHGKRC